MALPLNVARRLALDRALRREVENISKEQVADYSSRLETAHRIGQNSGVMPIKDRSIVLVLQLILG
jgi:hypothetical protein